MELYQIRYFLALARESNFTKAADKCYVSQPSLTRAIKNLEDELGGELFTRHPVTLTDLGKLMLPQFEKIYDTALKAKTNAKAYLNEDKPRLNLGIMCTIGLKRFSPYLSEVQTTHNDLDLNIVEGTFEELIDKLDKQIIDLAIVASPSPYPNRFQVRDLYPEPFVIAFPPGHKFEKKNALKLEDVQGENYVDRINCECSPAIDDMLMARNIDVNVCFGSIREDWIQIMIMAGMGISFMPESIVLFKDLPTRPLMDQPIVRHVKLISLADRQFKGVAGEFVGKMSNI